MDNLYNILSHFELVDSNQNDSDEAKEALAAVSLNQTLTWIKFVLTDDLPNANHRRVPKEEFSNLIKTGVFMPIKMEDGNMHGNHGNAKPLGVITHLKEVGNKIIGLAALWSLERPDDISSIKQSYSDKNPVELSWEILYEDAKGVENEDYEDLIGTCLKGVAIVGIPAYEGRTPIIEVASKKEDTLESTDLENKVAELENSVATLTKENSDLKELMSEFESLKQFKANVEKAEADSRKLESIKAKFTSAGISKDDKYFKDNVEKLLGLDENTLDFMIQEMASFAEKKQEVSSTKPDVEVPNLINNEPISDKLSIHDMAKKLKEMKLGNK